MILLCVNRGDNVHCTVWVDGAEGAEHENVLQLGSRWERECEIFLDKLEPLRGELHLPRFAKYSIGGYSLGPLSSSDNAEADGLIVSPGKHEISGITLWARDIDGLRLHRVCGSPLELGDLTLLFCGQSETEIDREFGGSNVLPKGRWEAHWKEIVCWWSSGGVVNSLCLDTDMVGPFDDLC